MRNMTLANMAQACNGRYIGDENLLNVEVTAITTDSRTIEEGCLFVAICGARVDGHDFIDSAFSDGAVCVMSEKELTDAKGPYILVESSLEAVKDLARFYRNQLAITVVGITGSVGKTSTKETVASVIAQKYRVLKTEKNFNNELGVPLTIFRLTDDDEIAVLEMGISDFDEMHRLSNIAKPDICIITNVGMCHLENLGDRDGVLKAKTEIFDFMNPNGTIILNGDDDKLITVGEVNGNEPMHFGMNSEFEVWAESIESLGLNGTKCTIHTYQGGFDVVIPIPGKHMVANAMAATLAGVALGMGNAEIRAGLERVQAINGRNKIIRGGRYTLIDDSYNANPMSMRASVDVLMEAQTRKVAILGDMGELGTNEKQLHYELGEYVGSSGTDLFLCVGELSKEMQKGFLAVRPEGNVIHYNNLDELFADISNRLEDGDAVLAKASHFMQFEKIVEELK